MTYQIMSPEGMNNLPNSKELNQIKIGDFVKLVFVGGTESPSVERMWVKVEAVEGNKGYGYLANDPMDIPDLMHGDKINFTLEHIIDITN